MLFIQRSFSILIGICAIILFALPAQAQIDLTLPHVTGVVGENKIIPISVNDVTDEKLTSYQFRIYYDPDIISITGYDDTGTLTKQAGGWLVANLQPAAGDYIIVAYAGSTPLQGAGDLLYLEVELNETGVSDLTFDQVLFYNEDADQIDVNESNGSVTVLEQYTLTVNIVGDGTVEVDDVEYTDPVVVDEGTTLSLKALADAGWEFSEWSGDLTGITNPDNILMDGDKEVTATFTRIQYTLTVNIVGDGTVEVGGAEYTAPVVVDEGTTLSLQALASAGWEFSEWSGDLTGTTNPDNLLMDSDKEVTATFTRIQYTLTVNIVGDGTVEVDGTEYTAPVVVDEGTTLSLEALADAGWEFSEWSGDLTGTDNPDDIVMDSDKEVTATFTRIQYTLTVNIVGQGTVEVDDVEYTAPVVVDEGTTLSLQALADAGWEFSEWSGDLTGTDNPDDILMNSDKTVTATFTIILKQYTIEYNAGWNLMGLPLSVADPHYKTLYPTAMDGTLWRYNGGYVNETELEDGRGYWLRFPGSGNVVIAGETIEEITLSLVEGWNLITGISYDVQLTEIDDPDDIIIPGTLWGYWNGYYASDKLEPGYGYWLRTWEPGTITLTNGGAGGGASTEGAVIAQAGTAFDDMQFLGSLSVEDALGNMQRLYFVDDIVEGKNRLQYSMPPLPPSGGFDARFRNDYYIGTDHESIILVQSQSYPLTVLLEDVEGEYILEAMRGEEILETYSVYAGRSVELMSESVEYFRLLNKERLIAENLPDDYGLSQNYPNPFNPSTTIEYALPQDAFVRLEVFNMLGQRVAVLVDSEQQAGYHKVVFDGSQLASGVYLYRLAADDFINMKRFVLIK